MGVLRELGDVVPDVLGLLHECAEALSHMTVEVGLNALNVLERALDVSLKRLEAARELLEIHAAVLAVLP